MEPSDEAARGRPGPAALDLTALEPPTARARAELVLRTTPRPVLVAWAIGIVVAAGVAWFVLRPEPAPTEDLVPMAVPTTATPATDVPSTTEGAGRVVAHAAGAVASPGLYQLTGDARVADLLQAAGGPTPQADLDRVNLAAPVPDGARVYVPARGEADLPAVVDPAGGAASPEGSPVGGDGAAGPVDINRATAEELDELPGIGPATAEAIIAHRTAEGPFASVDDLLDVRGIGEAKLAELRDLVTVG